MKVYVAHAMTGRPVDEVLEEGAVAVGILEMFGIEGIDPAAVEDLSPGSDIAPGSLASLSRDWERDKKMIRDCHVLLDLSGSSKSEGVAHEIGYARYFRWKPVVRLYKNAPFVSVATLEDDLIVRTIPEAAKLILSMWGTPWRRFKWRFKMYLRHRLSALIGEFQEWILIFKK